MKRKIIGILMVVSLILSFNVLTSSPALAQSYNAQFLTYSLPGQTGPATIRYNTNEGWLTQTYDGGATWSDYESSRLYDALFRESSAQVVYESNEVAGSHDYFAGTRQKAQNFAPSVSHTITSVQLNLYGGNNTAGNVVVSIRATDPISGFPTGPDLATGQLPASSIAYGSFNWYTFDLGGGAALTANTRYAIYFRAPAADADPAHNDKWIWYQASSPSNPYPTGAIDVTVAHGTNIPSLIAGFTTAPPGTSVLVNGLNQVSDVTANDFTNPVTYVLTSENTTKNWTVTVHEALNTAAEITNYSLPGQIGPASISSNSNNGTINVTVLNNTNLTNLVATFATSDHTASVKVGGTPQVSGVTPNNFANTVTYVVMAENTSITKSWFVSVTKAPPSTAAEILNYSLPGQTTPATITSNSNNGTISVTVLNSTNLANLVAAFTTSNYTASVMVGGTPQISGVTANNFASTVTYVVTAENTSVTKNWFVTVVKAPPSTAAEITSYGLPGQTGPATITSNSNNGTISVTVLNSTNLTNLVATFTTSPYTTSVTVGGVAQSSGVTPNNFTTTVTYVVTAENTSVTKNWFVTVAKGPPSPEAEILSYSLPGQTGYSVYSSAGWVTASYDGGVDGSWTDAAARTYDAVFKEWGTGPAGTVVGEKNEVKSGDPDVADNFGGGVLKAQSFTPSVSHTVTGIQLVLQTASILSGNVTVSIKATDTNGLPFGAPLATRQIPTSNITSGSWNPYSFDLGAGTTLSAGTRYAICMQAAGINGTTDRVWYRMLPTDPYAGKIDATVAHGTNLGSLVASFTTSPYTSSVKIGTTPQVSGVTPNNFTSPVTYVVAAENPIITKNWLVTVFEAKNTAAEILTYNLPGQTAAAINSASGTIGVTVVSGTNVANLKATFTTSDHASIKVGATEQISGTSPNNFSAPVTYVVTAESGNPKTWTVTVTVAPASTGGGSFGGGVSGGGVALGPGVTNLSPYTNGAGLFNLAAIIKSDDGKSVLNIAKGVNAQTKDGSGLTSIKIVPMATQPASTDQNTFIGLAYEITPEGATFSPAIALTIYYDPAKLPQNIDMSTLTIAVFNPTSALWEPVQSVPNKADSSVTANIQHFSNYAIIGKPVVVLPPPTTAPAPAPASFSVSGLTVSPPTANPGQTLTISTKVSNTGGTGGEYEVTLKINGAVETSKKVSVDAGATEPVAFTVSKTATGTYQVDVNGATASFNIVATQPVTTTAPPQPQAPATPTTGQGPNWLLIGIIIGAVVVVAAVLGILRMRRRSTH